MGGVAFQMEGFILSGMGEGRKKIVRADAPMPPTTMENPAPQPHPLLLTTTWKTLKPVNEWCVIALAHAHKYQY